MTFDYMQRIVVDAQLDVENIGECVILGRNDLGDEYYLIVRTELGFTELIQYGPACPEIQILPFNISMNYSRFEFSQGKIERAIDKFLNDPKKLISQAEVTTFGALRSNIQDSLNRIFPAIDNYEDELNE